MPRRFQFSLTHLLVAIVITAVIAWEVSMAMRPPAPPPPGQVIGHVEMEGTPLPGAKVEFFKDRGHLGPLRETALADKVGNFTVSLPPGAYEYSVRSFEHFGRADSTPRLCLFADQEGRVHVSSKSTSKLTITVQNRLSDR